MKKESKVTISSIAKNFFWDTQFKNVVDFDYSRKLILLNFVVIAAIPSLVIFGLLSLLNSNTTLGTIDLFAAFIISILRIHFLIKGKFQFTALSMIYLVGIFFLYLIFSGGSHYSGPLWSYTFPLIVLFILGRKIGIYYLIIFLVIILGIFLFDYSWTVYSLNYKLRFLGSFSVVTVIVYFFDYVREIMNDDLIKKNEELNRSFQKLESKEKELLESLKHYRTLFEASNDAIFLMDGSTFVDCNPKTLEVFGCTREEIIGNPPYLFSPQFQPDGVSSEQKAKQKISEALQGKSQIFEWVHCKLDKTEFDAEVRLDSVELNNRKFLLASVRDISERKLYEKELQNSKEAAERSEKLKSDFLAQMSHEIRTPINTILNYTSLLKMEFEHKVSADNSGSFKAIQNSSQRLIRTIDMILSISDIEAGTYDPHFEYANIVEKILEPVCAEFIQAAQNKNLTLALELPEEKHSFISNLDIYTVYQAVSNLVDNSIKYTESGFIKIKLENSEDYYLVKICDTGIGIGKDYIPRLFEKFSQEESGYTRRYEGSGLGLSLVKNYCEINHIKISVKSTKGKGTTFILEFPKVKG